MRPYFSECLLLTAVARASIGGSDYHQTCGLLETSGEKIGLNCLNGSPEITLNYDPLQVL